MRTTSVIHVFTKKGIKVTENLGWFVNPSDPHPTCRLKKIQDLGAQVYLLPFPLALPLDRTADLLLAPVTPRKQ